MSRVFIENSSLQDIADAIRIKNGSSNEYYPSEMAQAIEDIPTTGNMHDYLRFIALEDSTISILSNSSLSLSFEYSTNLTVWNTWSYTINGTYINFDTIPILAGNCIYIRGNNSTLGISSGLCTTFRATGKIAAYGNIMYLLAADGSKQNITVESCFKSLFQNCSSLVKAPELPATTLSDYCYYGMFSGCSSLIEAPELPATTLTNYCYGSMFFNCGSLVKAPELPATTLSDHCYYYMFYNCGSLIEAPELPATTLAESCYHAMFMGCTNLVKAKKISGSPTVNNCFFRMFYGCTSLSNITVESTNWSNGTKSSSWVQNVSASGTFTKPSGTTIPTGVNGIPSGWTVVNV